MTEPQPASTNGPAGEDREPATGPLLLADLTAPELVRMSERIEIVLIPVGAHEQHGPALPFSTDTLTAQVLCGLTGALLRPRVVVAPTVPWGVSWHHLGFAGTISLAEETLIAIVRDIVSSLHRHGFERFLIVNTHGGNNAALTVAVERCHRELGVPMVSSIYAYSLIENAAIEVMGEDATGHGGGDETAAVLAIRPELVDREQLGPRELDGAIRRVRGIVRAAGGTLPVMQGRVSPSGASGDSSAATADVGNVILGRAAGQLRAIVEELLALNVAR